MVKSALQRAAEKKEKAANGQRACTTEGLGRRFEWARAGSGWGCMVLLWYVGTARYCIVQWFLTLCSGLCSSCCAVCPTCGKQGEFVVVLGLTTRVTSREGIRGPGPAREGTRATMGRDRQTKEARSAVQLLRTARTIFTSSPLTLRSSRTGHAYHKQATPEYDKRSVADAHRHIHFYQSPITNFLPGPQKEEIKSHPTHPFFQKHGRSY